MKERERRGRRRHYAKIMVVCMLIVKMGLRLKAFKFRDWYCQLF